jgi:hypothetical protein
MASGKSMFARSVVALGVLLALAWCTPVQGRWLQDATVTTHQPVSMLLEGSSCRNASCVHGSACTGACQAGAAGPAYFKFPCKQQQQQHEFNLCHSATPDTQAVTAEAMAAAEVMTSASGGGMAAASAEATASLWGADSSTNTNKDRNAPPTDGPHTGPGFHSAAPLPPTGSNNTTDMTLDGASSPSTTSAAPAVLPSVDAARAVPTTADAKPDLPQQAGIPTTGTTDETPAGSGTRNIDSGCRIGHGSMRLYHGACMHMLLLWQWRLLATQQHHVARHKCSSGSQWLRPVTFLQALSQAAPLPAACR